jgi:hypothetical protein
MRGLKMEKYKIVLILVFILGIRQELKAQKSCEMKYVNRNQIDTEPYKINKVYGKAIDKDNVAIPDACIGIFTEEGHELVAQTKTDEKGNFAFNKVPAGKYRLIAIYNGFCPANTPFKVRKVKLFRRSNRRFIINFMFSRIDTCSYITYE